MIRKNSFPDIMTIMGFAVAALFLVFGLYILFSRQMANVPKEFRTIFGIIVISYGLFRSVIIYQKSKQRRNSDEESEF
jgi:prepilin signal peptidase PulO-like enzyme (type II secretory pathway)